MFPPNGVRGPASTPARAPLLELRGERRLALLERGLAATTRQRAQQPLRARIALADHPALVHHDHAVLHVTDDELVDLLHVGQVDLALGRELLARHGVARQRVGEPGNREVGRGEQPGLHVLGLGRIEPQHLVGVLEQHSDRGKGGEKQRQAPAADQARGGERGEQQEPQAAGDAAARIEEEQHESDVARNLQRQLQAETPARADQHEAGDGEHQVGDVGDDEERQVARAEPEIPSPDGHGEQQQGDQQAVDVEIEQRAPERLGSFAGGGRGVRLPQGGPLGIDRRHQAPLPARCARS